MTATDLRSDDTKAQDERVYRAVAAERERCAKIAEGWKSPLRPGTEARLLGHQEAAHEIAAAIRQSVDDNKLGQICRPI